MPMLQSREFKDFLTSQAVIQLWLPVKEPINHGLISREVNQKAFGLWREDHNQSLVE
jgi:hypothetical protein